jgi:signal transduction histidine kinase
MPVFKDELQTLSFLQGGGEMGMLIRKRDWSRTVLGDISEWPQSLRTTLSIILNSKFPMFLFWGPQLICFYNDAYRPSLGNNGKHPSILGIPGVEAWTEIWHIIKPLIDQVMNHGEAYWSEDQLIPIYRNGTIEDVYWTFSYSPVNDESGKIAGVFVTCTETTSKVTSLKVISEAEKKFRNLVFQAPVPTAVFRGPDMIIELANEEVLKLWGKDNSVIGKPIMTAIPELEGQPFFDLMKNVYSTGTTYEGKENIAYVENNGEIKKGYYNLLYKALYDNDGKVNGIICMGQEVTDQVIARKKIEESEKKKDDFIKMASHELKTPVTTIKGYIQLLQSKYEQSQDKMLTGLLTVIDNQMTRLTKLITHMLDVTKIETGNFYLNKEQFSINELIREITDEIMITALTYNIELDLGDGLMINADKDRISQVLVNLLTNAIKYSPGESRIIIKTYPSGNETVIAIKDFGIGIDSEDHEKIFDRFYRVEGKDEKAFPGFGIGLYIVKEIVSLHEGRIWVESERGNGSCFYFTLPHA